MDGTRGNVRGIIDYTSYECTPVEIFVPVCAKFHLEMVESLVKGVFCELGYFFAAVP
jgi:hypothetical protein